jgi:hypothetical protein
MKKNYYFLFFLMMCSSCNLRENGQGPSQASWKDIIIGDWVCEVVNDSIISEKSVIHSVEQSKIKISSDGTIEESEHLYARLSIDGNDFPQENDGDIFKGSWRLSNDTLYKEGTLFSIVPKKYNEGEELKRTGSIVKGWSIIIDVKKDTLFVLNQKGGTLKYVRR